MQHKNKAFLVLSTLSLPHLSWSSDGCEQKHAHASALQKRMVGLFLMTRRGSTRKICPIQAETGRVLKNTHQHILLLVTENLHLFHAGWSCKRSTCRIPSCGPRQVGLVCMDIHTALAAHSRAGPVWDAWGNEAGNLNYNLFPQTDWVCRVLEYFANGKHFWLLGNFLERNFVII